MIDQDYGFALNDCMCFVGDDVDFFYELMKVQKERMRYDTLKDEWRLYYEIQTHYEAMLTEDRFKHYREDFLDQFKAWLYKCEVGSECNLSQYLFAPIDCQLFELTAEKVYDQDYEHLEYLPLINHRVFPIGTDPNNPYLGT